MSRGKRSPGPSMMAPVNLSKQKGIGFSAKGDGKTCSLVVLTESRSGGSGELPATASSVAGPERKRSSFPLSTFEADGSDLAGLGFVKAMARASSRSRSTSSKSGDHLRRGSRDFPESGRGAAGSSCALQALYLRHFEEPRRILSQPLR